MHLPNNRWQAFGIHLGLSLVLFLLLSSIIYFVWYPDFLFTTDGGWQGIQLIAGVDLVIGPMLTLLVYNKLKKSLRFDLTVIAVLQVVCITGGMATVWYTKPLAVVYGDGTFYTINRISFSALEGKEAIDPDTVTQLQARQPVWLSTALPDDPNLRTTVLATWSIFRPLSLAVELYQSYEAGLPAMKKEGLSYAEGRGMWPDTLIVPEALQNKPEIRFYHYQSRFKEGFLAVDTTDGRVKAAL